MIRYLKFFTFLTQEEIAALEKQHAENPGARAAHKALAKAVTDLVHGPAATAEAMRASEILFGGDLAGISETTFNEIVGEVPTKEIAKTELDGAGKPLVELLVHGGLCQSKGQARKDIEGGGVYVNNIREASFQRAVTAERPALRQTPAPAQRQTQLRGADGQIDPGAPGSIKLGTTAAGQAVLCTRLARVSPMLASKRVA